MLLDFSMPEAGEWVAPRPQAQQARTLAHSALHLLPSKRHVLEALQRGVANKVIPRDLGIAEQTLKNHLSKLYERFEVDNRLEPVMQAKRLGLICSE